MWKYNLKPPEPIDAKVDPYCISKSRFSDGFPHAAILAFGIQVVE